MSHLQVRRAVATLLLLVGPWLALPGCVRDARGVQCDGGSFWCPAGMTCGADNRSCLETSCGDGQVQNTEECDPGSAGETDRCNANCRWSRCGDGKTNAAALESCDPGEARETATCDFDCTLTQCGDGVVNPAAGEVCDDQGESARCNANCTAQRCGDGVKNATAGEACDLGAKNADTGACLTSCQLPRCGDGHVQGGVEDCDEGPASSLEKVACPYGLPRCALCSQCRLQELEGPFCGDGVAQSPEESCDDGARNGATTCPYGEPSCRICDARCSARVDAQGAFCGDGAKNGHEACDDGARNGATACEYGTPTCSTCSDGCAASVSRQGSWCGDGVVDALHGEHCDGARATACGTCSSSCAARATAAATGRITVHWDNIRDGETLVISDGPHEEVFEFVAETSAPQPGHQPIVLPSTGGTDELANRIAAAVATRCTSDGGALGLVVEVSGKVVTLTSSTRGVSANQRLGPEPAPSGLLLEGMAGGVGCVTGQLCDRDEDCVSGHCTRGACE